MCLQEQFQNSPLKTTRNGTKKEQEMKRRGNEKCLADADFIFPFVGRTDEFGKNSMILVIAIQKMLDAKSYSCL